jgi:hypothetical protein
LSAAVVRHLSKTGSKIVAGRIYSYLNRRYFKGTLPKAVFHVVDNGAFATAERREGFNRDGSTRWVLAIICIHPYLVCNKKLLCRELLHEIVHIAWPRLEHGRRFEQKMIAIRATCMRNQLF